MKTFVDSNEPFSITDTFEDKQTEDTRLTNDEQSLLISHMLASIPQVEVTDKCDKGHPLQFTNNKVKAYEAGWICKVCHKEGTMAQPTLHCPDCHYDLCEECGNFYKRSILKKPLAIW